MLLGLIPLLLLALMAVSLWDLRRGRLGFRFSYCAMLLHGVHGLDYRLYLLLHRYRILENEIASFESLVRLEITLFLLALLSRRKLQGHLLACMVAVLGPSKVASRGLRLHRDVERVVLWARPEEVVYERYLLVGLFDLLAHSSFIVPLATPTFCTVQPFIAMQMLVFDLVCQLSEALAAWDWLRFAG